jgi:hypothetical protein
MIWPFRFEPLSISICAAIGVALQIAVHHYLAGRRRKENRRAKAKDIFRESIVTELSITLLDWGHRPKGIDSFLLQAVPKLQSAVQTYRPYVNAKDLASFDKAWEGFVSFCNKHIPDNKYTTAKLYPMMPGEDPAEILREHINQLLSFADR